MIHSTTLSSIFLSSIIIAILLSLCVIKTTESQIDDKSLLGLILPTSVTLFSIIISFSILTLGHSASNHTTTILATYMKDKFVWCVLLYHIFFIVSVLFTIFYKLDYSFIILELFIISIVVLIFYLIYMINLMNPIFMIKKIKLNIRSEIIKLKNKNDGQITSMNIEDKLLDKIKEHESALENIVYNSYYKRDHEVIKCGLEIYYYIIINITDEYIREATEETYIRYITRKIIQHGQFNIKNNDFVSFDHAIEIHKKIAIFLSDKKYNYLPASPLYGMIYSMSDLATMCINNKEFFPVYKIIKDLGDIGELSKNANTVVTIDIIFHIIQFDANNMSDFAYSGIKSILRVLKTATTIRDAHLEKYFERLSYVIQNISYTRRNELFSSPYFNDKDISLLLNYVHNTIQAYNNIDILPHRAKKNLEYFLKFFKSIQPIYDGITAEIMYSLIKNIESVFEDNLKETFSDVFADIKSIANDISSVVDHFENERKE